MASNSYISANITPSSDTFREWVDLTNRITYDMEKYVVTVAPTGNAQGAETIGNGYVNGFFGANTLKVFDGLGGATGNTTHYGTNAPPANLVFNTNAVFADDGTNTSIIHAQSNVHVTNVGIEFTSNTTSANITINNTADVFESSAGLNHFKTVMDIDANVDIDNDLVTINSGNVEIGANSSAGEFKVSSNATFTAVVNVGATSTNVNIGAEAVQINSSAALFQSNATLNDFNTNIDIDNELTTINAGNTFIGGNSSAGEFNVDSNTVFNANVHAHANRFEVSSNNVILTSNVDLFQSTATLNDIDSNLDIDNTLTDITTDDFNVSGANVTIDSTHVDIDGTELEITSNVDIDNTLTDINATDLNISGSNVTISSTNVNITSTGVNIGDAATDILTVNANTTLTDELTVNGDADFDQDVNIDGSAQIDTKLTVGGASTNAVITSEGNIDTDGTLTVAGASDLNNTLNVSGITTLENTQNSTSNTTGGTRISGGVGIAKSATIGGDLTVHDDIDGKDTLTIANASDLNGTLNVAGITTLENVTNSTSNTTGGLVVSGGAGIKKSVTIGQDATIEGNADVAGTLDVTGVTHLKATANVDGLLEAKDSLKVTGTANVSVRLNVGSNIHANATSVAVGDGSETGIVIEDNSIFIGNSTVNTALSTTAVFTDGTLRAEGATDLNSTLDVSGISTFENTTNSTSNTTGGVVISGGVGVAKAATIGEKLTVHGNADIKGGVILGDATADRVEVKGRVNTHIVPDATATRALGTDSLRWDLYGDDSRTRILQVSEDATIDGNLDVAGYADVGYPFTVSNTSTTAFKVQTRNAGNDREILIGNTVPTATAADDRLIIRSGVGNSTIGLLPLHGNNVPLGDADHRWVFSAKTGDFSGAVNITAATQATSNSTGSLKVAGGISARKQSFFGGDVIIEGLANVAGNLNVTQNLDITGTGRVDDVFTVGGDSANTRIFANGSIDTDGQINVASHANIATLGVTGAADFDSTVTVESTTSLKGDVDLGNASSDTISVNGQIDTSVEPTANGGVLGHADRRWAAAFTTVNSSGAALVGGTLGVTGVTSLDSKLTVGGSSTNAQLFANGSAIFDGAVNSATLFATSSLDTEGTLQVDGQSTFNDSISLNTDTGTKQFHIGNSTANITATAAGTLTARDLVITQSATLPSDTTLTASSLGATDLTVTGNSIFSAAADADAFIQFGTTSPDNDLAIDFQNAKVISDFLPDSSARDIGSDSKRWTEGHFDTKIQVGGSSRIVLESNSTVGDITADNIRARDELVGASSSDRNLKDNVLTIDTALGKIEQISGYEFEWNSNIGDDRVGQKDYGVIAQEVEEILPHAVDINSRGYKTVNYNNLIPLLIEAVKELSGKVEELERKQRREDIING